MSRLISNIPKTKKDQKIHAFLQQFGPNQDPDIRAYFTKSKLADALQAGESTATINGVPHTPVIMVYPYLEGKWTEDKICFQSKNHAELFAQKTGLPLSFE